MNIISAKIILKEENKTIKLQDLINIKFEMDCDIIVNDIPFSESMTLKKENNIIYKFKKNYSDLSSMFLNCSLLTSIDFSNYNTENVTNMYDMFSDCSSLTSIDLSKFNTKKVTNMSYMFSGCSSLASIDLSKFNTDNVTDMCSMFYGCSSLSSIDLTKFNTNNVENMSQ